MKKYKTINDTLEIFTLLSGLLGTLLTIFAIQIEPSFGHLGQEGVMIYHAVKVPHPNWVQRGIFFIILAFVSGIVRFIVTKIGEKR